MKTFLTGVVLVGFLSLPVVFGQATGAAGAMKAVPFTAALKAGGCTTCGAAGAPSGGAAEATVKPIPGSNETMVVGRIESLIPIGILTVLGCEQCSAGAVKWALQQGSSFDDIERTLQTVATMQKLDCFKEQFGPEVATRIEKPLAAAREALARGRSGAAK